MSFLSPIAFTSNLRSLRTTFTFIVSNKPGSKCNISRKNDTCKFQSSLSGVAIRNYSSVDKSFQSPWQHETPSGLKYRDVKIDNGIRTDQESSVATIGDKVSVHYTGYLPNSHMKIFDSSIPRGKPISFTLGEKRVIAGWEEGYAVHFVLF
jgi:FKBP-type peptidyl-prolyl cis-trans isomerase